MNRLLVYMIIGVSAAVIIGASFASSYDGVETIKVAQYKRGLEIYTKSGLDMKLSNYATKQEILDMLSNSQVVDPYSRVGSGLGPFLLTEGQTPNQYCKANGYGNCIMVINFVNEVYFNSKDLTCSNGINYNNIYTNMNTPANCNTVFNDAFYQTYNVDPRTKSAECVGGGYGDSDHWSLYHPSFICVKP